MPNQSRKGVVLGALALMLATSACAEDPVGDIQGEDDASSFSAIADDEVISLGGTEPFWSIEISGDALVYSTPENIEGDRTSVSRFKGNNGLGFSAVLNGQALEIAVTPGECSDGMSDRLYPYTATVNLGEATLFGCGHTESQPYEEDYGA